ncbi:hypothetical protein FRB95_002393 [Tulasnella sp. JGI-2019a]|nr:hypothetical protein FRB95_002393 [Tulasnella sp. JGI-2019a]
MASTPRRRSLHPSHQSSNPTTPRTYASASTDATNGGLAPSFSMSATYAFDWEAARGEKPAPYGVPNNADNRLARRKSSTLGDSTAVKNRVTRKESWFSRVTNYPSHLWFELTLIPQNLPFPEPKTLGRAAGVACHVLTMVTGYMAAPAKSEFDTFGEEWSDLRGEIRGGIPNDFAETDSGYGLAWICGWLLILGSFVNAFYVFTRFRTYTLMMRQKQNPIKSPNARFVKRDMDREQEGKSSVMQETFSVLGRQLGAAWRFLIGSSAVPDSGDKQDSIQELAMWNPGDFELALLTVYSPIHSLFHSMLVRQYWLKWTIITILLTATLNGLISYYERLVKDSKTLASEVMFEYNETFVYPRINVVKKDACVMTHEAEIVDYSPGRQSLSSRHDVPAARRTFIEPKSCQQIQLEKLQDKNGRPRTSLPGLTAGGLLRF